VNPGADGILEALVSLEAGTHAATPGASA
jgi:hypothetical protein